MSAKYLNKKNDETQMSFLDHLEALRWHIMRSLIVVMFTTIIVFLNKKFVFDDIIFAPKNLNFWTYGFLCRIGKFFSMEDSLCFSDMGFTLTNINMSSQFLLHLQVSFIIGLILASPYVLWEVWRFIKPALYDKERKYATGFVIYSSLLFLTGILFGYYLIVPFSITFLGNYAVSEQVKNTINLESYIDTLSMLVLSSGLIFEMPMVVYLLSKIGLLTPNFMRTYRRHAVVIIMVVGAIITPPDVMSQILISLPLYLLYELSIFISAKVNKGKTVT